MKKLTNQQVADRFDGMSGVSATARHMLETTDIQIFAEMFGDLETVEQLNEYAEEWAHDAE